MDKYDKKVYVCTVTEMGQCCVDLFDGPEIYVHATRAGIVRRIKMIVERNSETSPTCRDDIFGMIDDFERNTEDHICCSHAGLVYTLDAEHVEDVL